MGGRLQGPMTLMKDGYAKCGEVFTVPVLHKNITFLIGPHVSPHFFKANDDQLSQEEVPRLPSRTSAASRLPPHGCHTGGPCSCRC